MYKMSVAVKGKMTERIAIRAPKGTQIRAVLATTDADVKAGDPLFDLYDLEERKILSTIDRAIEENASKLAELSGERVAEKLKLLREVASLRRDAVTPSRESFMAFNTYYYMGAASMGRFARSAQVLALRTYQSLQASVEEEIYSRNIEDSKKTLALIGGLLNREREYVERVRARLFVAAPANGRFVSYVSAGTPVAIGHLLGEIQ